MCPQLSDGHSGHLEINTDNGMPLPSYAVLMRFLCRKLSEFIFTRIQRLSEASRK
jgi:hypothetical protein